MTKICSTTVAFCCFERLACELQRREPSDFPTAQHQVVFPAAQDQGTPQAFCQAAPPRPPGNRRDGPPRRIRIRRAGSSGSFKQSIMLGAQRQAPRRSASRCSQSVWRPHSCRRKLRPALAAAAGGPLCTTLAATTSRPLMQNRNPFPIYQIGSAERTRPRDFHLPSGLQPLAASLVGAWLRRQLRECVAKSPTSDCFNDCYASPMLLASDRFSTAISRPPAPRCTRSGTTEPGR